MIMPTPILNRDPRVLSDGVFAPLAPEEFAPWLAGYRPEAVHVRSARFAATAVETRNDIFDPGLHRAPTAHATRVQLVHHVGQTAFVLVGLLARQGRLAPLSEQRFLAAVADERCTFQRLALRFRHFIPNTNGLGVRLDCQKIRCTAKAVHLFLQGAINGDACEVDAVGVVLLDPSAPARAGHQPCP